jgi:hypothetical protein
MGRNDGNRWQISHGPHKCHRSRGSDRLVPKNPAGWPKLQSVETPAENESHRTHELYKSHQVSPRIAPFSRSSVPFRATLYFVRNVHSGFHQRCSLSLRRRDGPTRLAGLAGGDHSFNSANASFVMVSTRKSPYAAKYRLLRLSFIQNTTLSLSPSFLPG